jgi:serine/threonine-protein kinase
LRRALAFYDRALALDPKFARALGSTGFVWVWLADIYVPSAEAYPRALGAAERALAIDSLSADAHAVRGYAMAALTWDTTGIRELRRAVELDPNDAEIRFMYAQILCIIRNDMCGAGVLQMEAAVRLDPLWPLARWGYTQTLFSARRWDEAIAAQRRVRELDSTFFYADDWGAASWREKGDLARSLAEYESIRHLSPIPLYGMAITYARMGRTDEARRIAQELERLRPTQHFPPEYIALIYAALDDREHALEWLKTGRRERSAWMIFIAVLPEFDTLRDDPRVKAVMPAIRPPGDPRERSVPRGARAP